MFYDTLKAAHVTLSSLSTMTAVNFGIFLWSIPMGLYVSGAIQENTNHTLRALWITNVSVHVLTGVMVAIETFVTEGHFWPLQMIIIGAATYVTFSIPALIGYYLVNYDIVLVSLSIAALASACLANAAMISILFEYFHRRVDQTVPTMRANTPRGPRRV